MFLKKIKNRSNGPKIGISSKKKLIQKYKNECNGYLVEGLSSNMRYFVVEIMEDLDVMSTSRLLLPIDSLYIDIEDDTLLKLVGNDEDHRIFELPKCTECGYKKKENENKGNIVLENMRLFVKNHLKFEVIAEQMVIFWRLKRKLFHQLLQQKYYNFVRHIVSSKYQLLISTMHQSNFCLYSFLFL